jgi:hypothetical protein
MDGQVYRQVKQSPRLDSDEHTWRARPYAEFHASADKPLFHLDMVPEGWWKLYKGESFNLWEPDTNLYYGGVNPEVVVPELDTKRLRTSNISSSPFKEFPKNIILDQSTLPILNPRIAIRLVSSSTNSRTLIACLIPPHIALTHGAPYLLFPRGNTKDIAFVLGVLSSIPLDWVARRTVEVNVTYHIINSLPIPRPHPDDPRRLRVIEIAGRLAAVDARYQAWADAVGVPGGVSDER